MQFSLCVAPSYVLVDLCHWVLAYPRRDSGIHHTFCIHRRTTFRWHGGLLNIVLCEHSACVVYGPSRSLSLIDYPRALSWVLKLHLLHLIYTHDLAPFLASYAALTQLYADDVQAYLHCSDLDAVAATWVMRSIMRAMKAWMLSNLLQLNPSKTQLIWLGTWQ